MSTIIIGASGKKQAGKNVLCEGLMNYFRSIRDPELLNHFKNNLGIRVFTYRMYSFADALKEEVCMKVMGLTYEQCYGTDEEKNSFTPYTWDKLPKDLRFSGHFGMKKEMLLNTGPMTARQIMQVIGTNIFRKYFDDSIWVNATFRKIKEEDHAIALISDVRFPSEVEGVVNQGGYVIRLSRDVCGKDPHESETALDNYDFKAHGEHVYLLDNSNMSIEEQNNDVIEKYLHKIILKGE